MYLKGYCTCGYCTLIVKYQSYITLLNVFVLHDTASGTHQIGIVFYILEILYWICFDKINYDCLVRFTFLNSFYVLGKYAHHKYCF